MVCGWCGSKNRYQKDKCLQEIALHAQNMITILVSIVNIIGGDLYDHFISMRIFALMMNKILIRALKIMRKVATNLIWIC